MTNIWPPPGTIRSYRCNIRNAPIDGWETSWATTPMNAALLYHEALGTRNKDIAHVFVLRPEDNSGVNEPIKIDIQKAKGGQP